MADTNGSSIKSRSPKASSKANGKMAKAPSANGRAVKPARRPIPVRPSRGVFVVLFSIAARLVTWYAILSVLFWCPATLGECGENSPSICKRYFQAKHALAPHVEPYYNTYAAPYVKSAQPYYEVVNRTVITPAWGFTTKYGAPAAGRARALGQSQWEKVVQPQLVKAQTLAREQYDELVGPYVNRATGAMRPYIGIARTNALQTYHEILLPSYEFASPYARQAYGAASSFTTHTVVPSLAWAWNKTSLFLDGTVWPQLRVLYTETVEPQLLKIGKRLGRYSGAGNGSGSGGAGQQRDAASHATIVSKASSSFTKPTPSVTSTSVPVTSSLSSVVKSVASAIGSSASSAVDSEARDSTAPPSATKSSTKFSDHAAEQVYAPEPDENEQERRRIARETVAEDLKAWQDKYTKAADQSAAEIQERVEEIAKQALRSDVGVVGKGLLETLRKTIVSELVELRRAIVTIIGSTVKESATPQAAAEQILAVIRKTGLEIKRRAMDVRAWHETCEADMRTQVTAAADNQFQILGSIRDLALQKIGMKWAWMDGVTYKDWAQYHLLRSRFDEWQHDLEQLVVSHPSLIDTQNESQAIEDQAMKLAASAAKELARLKQVASWKLAAGDDSSEFDSERVRATFEAFEQVKAAAEAAAKEEAATHERAESQHDAPATPFFSDTTDDDSNEPFVSSATSASSSAPDELASHDAAPKAEPGSSEATGGFSSYIDAETATTSSDPKATLASTLRAVPDLPQAVANASEPTIPDVSDTEQPAPIGLSTAETTDQADLDGAASFWAGDELGDETQPSNAAESDIDYNELVESTEHPPDHENVASVKPAFLGAAAQRAPNRKPVMYDELDDDDSIESAGVKMKRMGDGEVVATISSVAHSAYSQAISRASEQYDSAVSLISANMPGGTALAVHEELLASVSAAYSRAASSASKHLNEAIQTAESLYGVAASSAAKMVPTPVVEAAAWAASVEQVAASHLSEGLAWAETQYSSAKVAIGLATPTPASPAERLLQNAQHHYYAGVGMAHARYAEFVSAASAALRSVTATPSPTNLAGSASSVASVVSENVAESWAVVLSRVSVQVYGAPTPTAWYDGLTSAAGVYAAAATDAVGGGASAASERAAKQYAAVSSIVAELLVGREQGFSESVYSRLGDVYVQASATAVSVAGEATDAAKLAGEKVASVASEATEAVKSAAGRTKAKDEL